MGKYISFIEVRIKSVNEFIKETHNYIKWQAPFDIESMSREDIFKVSCEAMRITVRLTQVIGWLMLQKAIIEEGSSYEGIIEEKDHILQGQACLDRSSEMDPRLPRRLRDLLKESRELYIQTMRLEVTTLSRSNFSKRTRKKKKPTVSIQQN